MLDFNHLQGMLYGKIHLSAWDAAQPRSGPYGSASSVKEVELVLEADEFGNPTPDQIGQIEYLIENQLALRDAVIGAVIAESIRPFSERTAALAQIPSFSSREAVFSALGLHAVHLVLSLNPRCIAFELGCDWDEEHGLGAIVSESGVRLGPASFAIECR